MIQSKSTKLKRGVELSLNGTPVWVELDSGGDCVFVCWQKTRDVTKGDVFEWVVKDQLKEAKKIGSTIKQVVKPVSAEEKKFRSDLSVYFASQILTMPSICENCNRPLEAYSAHFRKCTIAHILPKGKNNGNFKSVATHPQNRMFLCTKNGCHNAWDAKLAKERIKMNCYPIALERFEQFKDVLSPKELQKAYTYLNIEWQ